METHRMALWAVGPRTRPYKDPPSSRPAPTGDLRASVVPWHSCQRPLLIAARLAGRLSCPTPPPHRKTPPIYRGPPRPARDARLRRTTSTTATARSQRRCTSWGRPSRSPPHPSGAWRRVRVGEVWAHFSARHRAVSAPLAVRIASRQTHWGSIQRGGCSSHMLLGLRRNRSALCESELASRAHHCWD